MNDILNALGPFAWGFAIGFFWYPLWTIVKKIWSEAKLARDEWSRPRG
jgi:hypothetical protein